MIYEPACEVTLVITDTLIVVLIYLLQTWSILVTVGLRGPKHFQDLTCIRGFVLFLNVINLLQTGSQAAQ